MTTNRYALLLGDAYAEPQAASGWQLSRCLPASGLYGANGMQFGPDGRLYVTQAFGSQLTALDVETGAPELISPLGGAIVAPDDVAFDSHGTMYVTEVMSARVCQRTPAGEVSILADKLPAVNGITCHQDRLFADEFRGHGRVLELYPYDERPPRVIVDDQRGPNALAVGPDGKLYYPLVPLGEVWRADVETGDTEKVAEGLKGPPAVKFNSRGELIVPQAGSGEVVRIDIQTGAKTVLATVRPGIDNIAIHPDDRLFVSHFVDGGVSEVATDGSNAERVVVPGGLVGPWGLACAENGGLYIADGLSLATFSSAGEVGRLGGLLDNSFPGFVRGMAAGAPGELLLTTMTGDVVRYNPEALSFSYAIRKLDQPYGLAREASGSIVVAEAGTGSVLRVDADGQSSPVASGLSQPCSVVMAEDGSLLVSEVGTGRVSRVDASGNTSAVADGLQQPLAMAVRRGAVLILDHGSKTLESVELATRQRQTLARQLPVGNPPGLSRGPMAFGGSLAVDPAGTIYLPGDAEGSVLMLREES